VEQEVHGDMLDTRGTRIDGTAHTRSCGHIYRGQYVHTSRIAGRRQQPADSKQQAADSRQQTAGNRQQTAGSGQRYIRQIAAPIQDNMEKTSSNISHNSPKH
jgi:hypothetical protein